MEQPKYTIVGTQKYISTSLECGSCQRPLSECLHSTVDKKPPKHFPACVDFKPYDDAVLQPNKEV